MAASTDADDHVRACDSGRPGSEHHRAGTASTRIFNHQREYRRDAERSWARLPPDLDSRLAQPERIELAQKRHLADAEFIHHAAAIPVVASEGRRGFRRIR